MKMTLSYATLIFLVVSVLPLTIYAQKKAPGQLEVVTLKESLACDKTAAPGDMVSVHYVGKLKSNGKMFDSSRDRGEPITFELGAGRVIQGWEQAIKGMCPGELRRLTIPPHLGYGDRGAGEVIPPGATLVFEVELMNIYRPSIFQTHINWDMIQTLIPVFIFVLVAVFFVWRASQVEVQNANSKKAKSKAK